ncbi:hypothetical protein QFZ74_005663 [Streptomyces sp. V3I7]|nr:hypothetical protein [Streptomyces sp. V3I7]
MRAGGEDSGVPSEGSPRSREEPQGLFRHSPSEVRRVTGARAVAISTTIPGKPLGMSVSCRRRTTEGRAAAARGDRPRVRRWP